MSGLLVKSAHQMVITAQDFKEAGIDVPILVGGAALSRRFTETKISAEYDGPVLYAKDAMHGLDLANRLQNQEDKEILLEELGIQQEKRKVAEATRASKQAVAVLEKPVKTVEKMSKFTNRKIFVDMC